MDSNWIIRKKMNGIGIHSMKQRREWRERGIEVREKKKKKKETKGTRPQWYSLLWFHHRRVDSIWVRIIKDCLSFSRRENTSCKYPQYPRPVPVPFRRAGYALLPLFSRVNTFPAPIIPPPPSRKNRKNLKAPLNRVHVFLLLRSPPFSNASFFFPPFVPRLFATVRVFLFTERVSRDVTPAFRSPLLLVPSFFPSSAFEALDVRATEQTSRFETNQEEDFLGYLSFSFRCCRFSPPSGT